MSLKKKAQGVVSSALLSERTRQLRHKLDAFRNREHALAFYYQPDDPYSHLLAQLVPELVSRYPVRLEPLVVPAPADDANPEPDLRTRWAARDARELSRYLAVDLPPGPESPVPEQVDLATRILTKDRPTDEQLAAMQAVGDALWSGDQSRLEQAASELGTDPPDRAREVLDRNHATLRDRGHYQGGMLQYGSEWYWGVDRIPHLEARFRDEGLGEAPSVVQKRDTTPCDELPEEDGKIPLELYYSFRSPYSYVALRRVLDLALRYPVDLRIKPVLPMVMRGLPVPRAKQIYIVQDVKREADRVGVPFGKICDPVGAGVERCFAIFPYAYEAGRAGRFLESAGRGCWAEGLDLATDDDLRVVVERAGLDWSEATRRLADEGWRQLAEKNRADLFALGLWGVPSFALGGYTCWGQDRLWILEDKIRRHLEQT